MKRVLIGLLVLLLIGAGGAWMFRKELVLFAISNAGKTQAVAPYSPVKWAQGPAAAKPAATSNAQTPKAEERPPNIIFILADDLGINDISAFGGGVAGGRVKTLHIDRLAAQGAIFTQAYAGNATCAPSRAMIMTGRYPTRTGFEFTPTPDGMGRVVSMFQDTESSGLPALRLDKARAESAPPYREQGLPGSEVTIAEVLKGAGYHTVHIGKWHTGLGPEFGPNAQGFDESLLMASGLYLPENHPDVVNAKLPFDPIDKFLWARMEYAASYNDGPWFEPGGYLTDWWTDEAISVIKANRHRPFFLNLAHWGVHTPLQATRADYEAVGDLGTERLRVYAAMIRALDRSVGRILDALESEGLAENTLIVFTSDNGGAGYIGIDDVNKPYRGWKMTFFEGGLRVPYFASWPAKIAAGTRIDAPVAHIDLMPTLAAAGRGALPKGVEIDGVNLLPLAIGPPLQNAPSDRALFWQSAGYRVVRKGDWKLQTTEAPARAWLFNLADDPTEQRDLSRSNPQKLAELRALIAKHQANARPPLYPHSVEAPIAVDYSRAKRAPNDAEIVYWAN
ncbi:MAG: sulfatase [Caulobacterales bacterium]|jgi:uncharacterized sulfatase